MIYDRHSTRPYSNVPYTWPSQDLLADDPFSETDCSTHGIDIDLLYFVVLKLSSSISTYAHLDFPLDKMEKCVLVDLYLVVDLAQFTLLLVPVDGMFC